MQTERSSLAKLSPGATDGSRDLFLVLPRGVEDLATAEVIAAGGHEPHPTSGGLRFRGDLAAAYRVCLWSRVASRVLMPIARVPAASSGVYYDEVRAIPWDEHLAADETFAVEARVRGDRALNSHFVALKTKDAIVDRLRDRHGRRPDVDRDDPGLSVHVLVDGSEAQLSLDLSGEPLHRRGYRGATGAAPLKENVAAAMLLRAGWPAIAARGGAFVDPLCGAGTLLVEAAFLAGDVAPGLLRDRFGFHGWRGHDERLWRAIRDEADARARAGLERLPPIGGSDRDLDAVERARDTVEQAGLRGAVSVRRAEVADCMPPPDATPGLVATNAPYGQRIGGAALPALYRRLGETMKTRFQGWRLALLTADAALAGEVRMRASRRNTLYNGGIRCELLQYTIGEAPGAASPPLDGGATPRPGGRGRAGS